MEYLYRVYVDGNPKTDFVSRSEAQNYCYDNADAGINIVIKEFAVGEVSLSETGEGA
jgi:hypothetical protein